jgi:MYXO-CTERM domain-containing protein
MKSTALIVAAGMMVAASTQAAIIGTTGNIVQIGAPASVTPGALFTFPNAVAFNERQFATGAGIGDITANPWVAPPLSPGPWAGVVNSHFVHVDPPPTGALFVLNGSVTFDGAIIAVMLTSPGQIAPNHLDTSDFLGALGTVYPTGHPFRGWNGSGTVGVFGSTIRFTNVTVQPGDFEQFRVLTQVPTPGSLALLGVGGLLTMRRRRH